MLRYSECCGNGRKFAIPKGKRWIKQKYFERVRTRDWWFFGEAADGHGFRFKNLSASNSSLLSIA